MKRITLLTVLFALLFAISPVQAEDEVRNLVLDLKAKGFSQPSYQDNLQSQDIIFAPNNRFQLKLTISNRGNRNQTNVKVTQLLPNTVTTDFTQGFTIPQIAANQEYVKDIVVTVKDKQFIPSQINLSNLRFTAKSDVGSEPTDTVSFYTGNGSQSASATTVTTTKTLPNTGPETTIIFGSLIASAIGLASLKLRQLARGY